MSRFSSLFSDQNRLQCLFCLVGGFSCLLPLCITKDSSQDPLLLILESVRFRDSAIFALCLTLPVILDLILQAVLALLVVEKDAKVKVKMKEALLNTRELLVLYCGILTIPISSFFPTHTHILVSFYVCVRRGRTMFVFGAVVTSLCRYDRDFWPLTRTYCLLFLVFCGTLVGAFADAQGNLKSSTLRSISVVFYAASGALFSYGNIRWLYFALPKLRGTSSCMNRQHSYDTLDSSNVSRQSKLVYPLLYATATTLFGVAAVCIARSYPGSEKFSSDAIYWHNLLFLLYFMVVTYLSDKMVKQDVVQGLYDLIESKKTYVRYISHELRTPLNTAFLGLKIVCDDCEMKSNQIDAGHQETLLDVQSACRIAVEILNDLLCFDKLESGILELHKQDVAVTPFIASCVKMFASQAKEEGVTMINTTDKSTGNLSVEELNHIASLECTSPSSILDNDVVMMDKFKMDQVLRNLISNALKFTPRGGTVTVSASFIPDESSTISSPSEPIFEDVRQNGSRTHPHPTESYLQWPSLHNLGWKRSNASLVSESTETDDDLESALGPVTSHTSNSSYRTARTHLLDHYYTPISRQLKKSFNRIGRSESESTNSNIWPINDNGSDLSDSSSLIHGKLRIVVVDTGVGISQDNQVRLFKEVVQFNPEILQAGGGSGLGLWITSNIVNMHGGTIHAYSAGLGKGTTFTVELNMTRHRPVQNLLFKIDLDGTGQSASAECAESVKQACVRALSGQALGISVDTVKNGSHRILSSADNIALTAATVTAAAAASVHIRDGHSSPRSNPDSVQPSDRPLNHILDVFCTNVNTHCTTDVNMGEGAITHGAAAAVCSKVKIKEDNQMTAISKGEDSQGGYDVLVVDDSSLNRKMLCKLLRTLKCTMEEADDGLKAVERVRARMAQSPGLNRMYDVILMDFVMPNMDGPTATQAIRALGYSGPILGVTGNTLDSDVTHFIQCGANAVLPKPFDLSLFRVLMKDHEARTLREQLVDS